jgi:hypothetical protein
VSRGEKCPFAGRTFSRSGPYQRQGHFSGGRYGISFARSCSMWSAPSQINDSVDQETTLTSS